jgi:molecular chaperone GrpE
LEKSCKKPDTMHKKDKSEPENNSENQDNINNSDIKTENDGNSDESAENNDANEDGEENNQNYSKTTELEEKTKELNDKYLRLYSEFDNYRKRSIKERSELIKTAGEEIFKSLLPVIDDFERAIRANEEVTDATPVKEGVMLIYNKLKHNIQQKGLVAFNSLGEDFDADIMEAVAHIPATDESQRGKVIDELEKGYKLGDKVIRFAKVVVAQ